MSCFRIPKELCRDIERACARFWWGHANGNKGISWLGWAKMCKPKGEGGMGFRDLEQFNKALMAKQVWQLLQNPQALISKFMRAKYYPSGSVMDAQIKSNASFIWRSVVWSRSLIEEGSEWRVRDGSSIWLFQYAFIPQFARGKPVTNIIDATNTMVSEVLDNVGAWKESELDKMFWPCVKESIMAIPTDKSQKDVCFWKYNADGRFTVKSAYWVAIGNMAPHPNQSEVEKKEWYTVVWSLRLPPKVRVFLWKFLRDCLHVPVNLMRRRVSVSGVCKLCHEERGDALHVLFFCKRTKAYWDKDEAWLLVKKSRHMPLVEIAAGIRHLLGSDGFEKWVVKVWMVWSNYCAVNHGNEERVQQITFGKVEQYVERFKMARKCGGCSTFVGFKVGDRVWKPPAAGLVRVDVDARYAEEANSYGIGVVVRDDKGRMLAAMAKSIPKPTNILEAEILVGCYGVGVCLQEVKKSFLLYLDSANAVTELKYGDGSSPFLPEDMVETINQVRGDPLVDLCICLEKQIRLLISLLI